ncbi:LysM peptidoglycan-binding domain-containing protein [Blautia schinkii]|uniref:LysM peptidoglycan-binding domain-containing protein n=1 Tax=Blautia TaxID=572511 RepID=UPI001D0136FE|nr:MULTISPECIES: LysM peptidoglycan-binding domain-containing protein [Blautia]MCB5522646.1 LysM peptidoglycan-binding domain-containing protein [Blautia schinkii]
MLASGDTFSASNALMYGFNELGNGKTLGFTTDATQNALSTMYESMKPDVTQMQGLIDDYREAGKAVPQSLMDSFNEAVEVGAAAGDTAATWQNYANQIWQNGSDELKASLTDPSNPMYETIRSQLPPELTEAIDRAAAETTTEDVTLEGLKASVDGDVDIDKDKWVSALNEKLGDLATTEEVTAEGATIKVEAGDCLWDIGNALGVDWRTIAEENGIESPYVIHPGDEIKISMDTLTAEVDGDAAQSAIDQAMSALTTEGAEFSVTAEGVQVDLSDVQVDSESAAAQIEAALGMESGTLAANGIEVQTGARVLQQRIKETMEDGIGDIEPDFGVIGKDGSLTTNMFPIPIPKGEYYLGRLVSGLKINISGGSHGGHNSGNGSHEHSVTLPKVKAGDTVLVTWVKNTPVVVDVVKKS